MAVPYGDPRMPYHKKSAFDLGDAGAGSTANNLSLGCDCLGLIQYLSFNIFDDKGQPSLKKNCICIHEQDAGISWKHTNFRTDRAVVARNRELVLQNILTLGNYEYILAFIFNQTGEVHYEVRATGILNTQPIKPDIKESPYGTVVHPGVLATVYQHMFCLRVDPAIDGHRNRVAYDEAHQIPRHPETNPHGVGYAVSESVVETSGGYNLDYSKNRTYKIQNSAVRNPVNNKSVGFKTHMPAFQPLLPDTESFYR